MTNTHDGERTPTLSEIRGNIERQGFDAVPDDVVLALVEVVEAAHNLRQRVVFSAHGEQQTSPEIGRRLYEEATARFAEALSRFSFGGGG